MAIKGITIEFNGDTTKLDKALRSVDKTTREIDKELNAVKKSLKFNPENVDLWRQKQTLLSEKIEETKKRVDLLRQAQKQMDTDGVDKNSAQYRELQREIIESESKLKHFNAEQKKIQAALSPLGQFSSKMKGVGSALENAGQKMKGFSVAAGIVVGALSGMAVKAAQSADDINTMSKIYSLSTKDLQKYSLAANQVDVSVETIAKSHVKLEKNMLSAAQGSKNQAEAFKTLGVEYKNTDGSLRNADDVWTDLIKSLGTMANETERDAYAMQLMGKSAAELNPLIENNGETYERLGQLFEKYGLDYIDQETLDKANEFNDLLDDTRSIGQLMIQTVGANLSAVLAPALETITDLIGKIAGWLANLNPTVLAAVGAVSAVIAVGAPLLIGLGKVAFAISSITSLAATLGISFGAIASAALPVVGVIAAVTAAGVLLYKNWDTIKSKASNLKTSIVKTWENIKTNTKNKFNSIKNAIVEPIEKAKDKIKEIIDKIKSFFSNAKFSLPHIKLPHFKITPSGWDIGDLLKGSIPKLSINWYKNGAIFDKASVIGVGEAGREAVVPLTGEAMRPFAEAIAKNIGNTGNTYNIGDIIFDVSKLEDVATVEQFINLMRRVKEFA